LINFEDNKRLPLKYIDIEEPPDKGHVPGHQSSSADVLDVRLFWDSSPPVVQVLSRQQPIYAVMLDPPVSMPSPMLLLSPSLQGHMFISASPTLLLHGSVLVPLDRARKKNFKLLSTDVTYLLRTWIRTGFICT